MPSTRRHSYDLNFKLKTVAEAEAVNNNHEIACEYGIYESMVRKWKNQQHLVLQRVKDDCQDDCQTCLDGSLQRSFVREGVCQLRIEVPRRMQASVHKKAWMEKEVCSFSFIIFRVFNSDHDKFLTRFVVKFASFNGS